MRYREHNFRKKSKDRLSLILQILEDYKKYRPMSLRQIFYLFLSKNDNSNLDISYMSLSNLLSSARYCGVIPFNWISDGASYTRNEPFNLEDLAHNYYPYAWENQDNYIEFIVEKYALYPIFREITRPLYIITTYSTGFLSDTRAMQISKRLHEHEGKNRYIYSFTDYDPSGESMPKVNEDKIMECLHILEEDYPQVIFQKPALTERQVKIYNLPPKNITTKDQRSLSWDKDYKVELDALEPDILHKITINEIEPLIKESELMNIIEKEKKIKEKIKKLEE